eukprot:GHVH01004078.1.p1 GENE.GHVH01004078.1~~GHVH01004078.1.p1  ORF type:complete len:327 (-),score=28.84 GHVH01004078.1:621-1601(-)
MSDLSMMHSIIGPFLDTLWYTTIIKVGIPNVQIALIHLLGMMESRVDRLMLIMQLSQSHLVSILLRSIYETIIVMQSPGALEVLSFLGVRMVFDNFMTLGYGFGPEIGFISRLWKNQQKRPSIRHCSALACSSLAAVAVFHYGTSNFKPGALGVWGPLQMGPEGHHFLGLSIIAEFVASVFFYSGFLVCMRCDNTKNTCLLKLILNLAGVYLVQKFTFDTLSTGAMRSPLRCWAAAASSAFENNNLMIFVSNAFVHSLGLAASGHIFGAVTFDSELKFDGRDLINPKVVDDGMSEEKDRSSEITMRIPRGSPQGIEMESTESKKDI